MKCDKCVDHSARGGPAGRFCVPCWRVEFVMRAEAYCELSLESSRAKAEGLRILGLSRRKQLARQKMITAYKFIS